MTAYICSPYRGDVAENQRKACEYCRDAMKRGYTPIAPHLLFPQFLDDDVPEERQKALDMCSDIIQACSIVLVYGKGISAGMAHDIQCAIYMGKPVTIATIKEVVE